MGRFKSKSDYEEIRKARIDENQTPESEKKKYCATVLRRSPRLGGQSPPSEGCGLELVTTDYEEIRKARIVENQAPLATLGLQKALSELNSPPKSEKKKHCKVDYSSAVVRRSPRFSGQSPPSEGGRLELVTTDYEEIRKARIVKNQARLATLGLQKSLSELRFLNSPPKSEKKKPCKVDYSSAVLQRSPRFSEQSPPSEGGELELATNDYEEIRKARIIENQARLATLGLQTALSELRSLNSPPKSEKTLKRKNCKVDYSSTVLRRSARFSGKSPPSEGGAGKLILWEGGNGGEIVGSKRRLRESSLSEEDLRRRCDSKARGSVYDPIYGICCHFCRQKKLCGEEDCKRCGDRDLNQPCIGKTDCSVCHSTNGILCRACLKVRYGEEMEEVRSNKEWMCPHCIEETGTKPNWICNSSFCMKRRKLVPTGIAIYRAREMGYESVAHLLMAELSKRR